MRLAMKRLVLPALVPALCGLLAAGSVAHAQSAPNSGFQLNRYEPTAAGEWSFAVDHPWYSSTRYFAAGITLNYAHNPLVLGTVSADGSFSESQPLISHHFISHIDLAGSFLDRILVTGSLPVILVNQGDQVQSSIAVGDPRLGVMGRLYGQPYQDVFSVSLGANVWIPLRAFTNSFPSTSGDQSVRVMPKLVLGGIWKKLLWSFTGAFLYRPEAVATDLPAAAAQATVGRASSEMQFGLAASYYDTDRRFAVGPEVMLTTALLGQDSLSRYGTSLEAMLAGHYNVAKMLQVGLAAGVGFIRQPGTPDLRLLARIAYAPTRSKELDTDGDGIADKYDACPTERGVPTGNPRTHGCPPVADRDRDGVPDIEDVCPDEHKGPTPDPMRLGCPMVAVPPPPKETDRDGDGIVDSQDQCPDVPKGPTPDTQRLGCPAQDSDKDGVLDPQDQCLFEPAGLNPDPARPGCPLADKDKDNVPDAQDACPDKPGAPNPDPKKNGCPGLVEVKNGQLVILQPVFFATDKDVILPKSFPVLQAVADAMKQVTSIKRVAVDGHTDSVGSMAHNMDLSERRTKSVRRWLMEHGIAGDRLENKGYGPTKPIAENKTPAGRAKNRRVEFRIVDGGGTTVQGN